MYLDFAPTDGCIDLLGIFNIEPAGSFNSFLEQEILQRGSIGSENVTEGAAFQVGWKVVLGRILDFEVFTFSRNGGRFESVFLGHTSRFELQDLVALGDASVEFFVDVHEIHRSFRTLVAFQIETLQIDPITVQLINSVEIGV